MVGLCTIVSENKHIGGRNVNAHQVIGNAASCQHKGKSIVAKLLKLCIFMIKLAAISFWSYPIIIRSKHSTTFHNKF
jgi:hypothetical protein